MDNNNSTERFLVLSDLLKVLQRKWLWIAGAALAMSILTAFYALQRPVKFTATATFKESGSRSSRVGMSSLLMGAAGIKQDSSGCDMMVTRKLMVPLVREHGLQASVSQQKKGGSGGRWGKMRNNLAIEYISFKKLPKVPIKDTTEELVLRNVAYGGEFSTDLSIVFTDEETFDLFNKEGHKLASGKLGEELKMPEFTFTPYRAQKVSFKGKTYNIGLNPEAAVAEDLIKELSITPPQAGKGILSLEYSHSNRQRAAQILNNVMFNYQRYLYDEADRYADQQLSYLNSRKQDAMEDFDSLLQEDADYLSNSIQVSDFMTMENELQYLAELSQNLKKEDRQLDAELLSLDRSLEKNDDDWGVTFFEMDAEVSKASDHLNEINNRLNSLKEERDALEFSLRTSSKVEPEQVEHIFYDNLVYLQKIRDAQQFIKDILENLSNDQLGIIDASNNDFLDHVPLWSKHLQELYEENNANYRQEKKQFSNYLHSLQQVLINHSQVVQERIARHQSGKVAFDGMDLSSAENLFYSYSSQLDMLQSEIQNLLFVKKEMEDENFEISSISTFLNDSISSPLIQETASILRDAYNSQNYSAREMDRLHDMMNINRDILRTHVDQKLKMLEIQEGWRREQVLSLQRDIQATKLDLIRREIVSLENRESEAKNNLLYLINNKLLAMKDDRLQQKQDVEQQILELRQSMKRLPYKWVTEQKINARSSVNKQMLDKLTRMVDDKIISYNLESIESGPVDLAIAPTHPESPRLFFFMFLGLLMGAVGSSGFFLLQGVWKGFPVSTDNLLCSGYNYAGTLTLENKQATLRKVLASLPADQEQGQLIMAHQGRDYFQELSRLLKKRGDKVMVLDFSYSNSHSGKGLIHYLENDQEELEVVEGQEYDCLAAEVWSEYLPEFMASRKFANLLAELKQSYDWIIVVTDFKATDSQATATLKLSDAVIVSLADEKVHDLDYYSNNSQPVIFVSPDIL
ncbi:MAG: hypothetical protein ACQEP8_01655 [Chlamydiota bacterium]